MSTLRERKEVLDLLEVDLDEPPIHVPAVVLRTTLLFGVVEMGRIEPTGQRLGIAGVDVDPVCTERYAVGYRILDIHCTTNRPHDTKIGWQVLIRNLDWIRTITADKGYDWASLRDELRVNGVKPIIKHREFASLNAAHNARLDDEVYHRRTVAESVFATLKQRYGDRLAVRTWHGQFRELAIKAAMKI